MGFTNELSRLRVWAFSVTGYVVVIPLSQCGDLSDLLVGFEGGQGELLWLDVLSI